MPSATPWVMRLVAGSTVEAQYASKGTARPRPCATRLSNSGPSNPEIDARLTSAKARSSCRAETLRIMFMPPIRPASPSAPRAAGERAVRGVDLDAALDAFVAITMVARDVAGGIARKGDFLCPADRTLN